MKRYGCAIAVALLAASVGAGCGGDDDAEPLTKAEYIKQGDAICKKANADFDKQLEEKFPDNVKKPSEEQLTTLTEDVLKPNIEGQLNDLRDLTPPESDEETLNATYDKLETALAKVEDDPKLLLSGEDPFATANKEAQDYGFKECGEG